MATDVTPAYIKCINMCGKPNVTIWADNCAGQNKNWLLFSALAWCVNAEWGPHSVTLKYLEKGHTFMKADSIHAKQQYVRSAAAPPPKTLKLVQLLAVQLTDSCRRSSGLK